MRFNPIHLMLFISTHCFGQISDQFRAVGADLSGITFTNTIVDSDEFNMVINQNHWNGGGVSIGDINSDGLPDIFFTGNQVGNRLYLNKGNLQFVDISQTSGIVENDGWNTGSLIVDVNGDGLLDIYVCRGGTHPENLRRNLLYINNGDETFTENAMKYGVADSSYSIHATFFDYDLDGDLDLYVVNNHNRTLQVSNLYFKQDYSLYSNDIMYRNDNGRFTDISEKANIKQEHGLGLSVISSDFNDDGFPDLFVANDLMKQDYLLINNGKGGFEDQLNSRLPHISRNSMGCDAADFDNDLMVDLMVVDMYPEDNIRQKTQTGITNDHYDQLLRGGYYHQLVRNVLQQNIGNGMFRDVAHTARVAHSDWSWGPLFLDFDNDGFKDLIVTNSLPKDMLDADFQRFTMDSIKGSNKTAHSRAFLLAMDRMKNLRLPNYIFKNEGGLVFSKSFFPFGPVNSSGIAFGDLDNDGDLDLVTNNLDTLSFIIENLESKNQSIRVKLRGDGLNTFAIGSRAILYANEKPQLVELGCARGYQSSSEPILHFGIGENAEVDSLVVYWAGGKCSSHTRLDRTIINEISFESGENKRLALKSTETITTSNKIELQQIEGINAVHKENVYDDFKAEPLLVRKLSAEGPGLAAADINADGMTDVFLGGTESKAGQFLIARPEGRYAVVMEREVFLSPASTTFYKDDVYCAFSDIDDDGDLDLLKVKGGNEKNLSDNIRAFEIYLNDGRGKFSLDSTIVPPIVGNCSVAVVDDFDGDGTNEVFIGGRSVAGKYGLSPSSYLLALQDGRYSNATSKFGLPDSLGMVTDAISVDLNSDSRPDLVVVGELMAPRVFINVAHKLVEQQLSDSLVGLWNCIEALDIDGDDDTDLVLGNLGTNSKFSASDKEPYSIYYGDFDRNGSWEALPTYFNAGVEVMAPSRDVFLDQLYTLRHDFNTYRKFASATPQSIFKKFNSDFQVKRVKEFKHLALMNNGRGGFEAMYLPSAVQACNVKDIVADDVDKDGMSDLILVGNDRSFNNAYGKMDGCPGTILMYNGSDFNTIHVGPLDALFDQDCRHAVVVHGSDLTFTDYIVGINNATLKVFRRHNR
jgi:hypothetical protein